MLANGQTSRPPQKYLLLFGGHRRHQPGYGLVQPVLIQLDAGLARHRDRRLLPVVGGRIQGSVYLRFGHILVPDNPVLLGYCKCYKEDRLTVAEAFFLLRASTAVLLMKGFIFSGSGTPLMTSLVTSVQLPTMSSRDLWPQATATAEGGRGSKKGRSLPKTRRSGFISSRRLTSREESSPSRLYVLGVHLSRRP